MLQESDENFLGKTVFFKYTWVAAGRRQNPIWITNMFAVISNMKAKTI